MARPARLPERFAERTQLGVGERDVGDYAEFLRQWQARLAQDLSA